MSRLSSRSCTTSPKRRWSLSTRSSRSRLLAGAFLDQRTPQLDQLARGRRRHLAGEPLAHHHGECVLDRRVGAVGDLVEFAAVEAIIEHGGEILGHAAHAARTDGLDAGLFDRFEHGAGLRCRRAPACDAPRGRDRRAAARWNRRDRARWPLRVRSAVAAAPAIAPCWRQCPAVRRRTKLRGRPCRRSRACRRRPRV